MRCNWRRWLWGVIPIVGLGLAAAQLERAAIEKDLTERAQQALADKGVHWAVVNFSGRDVVLTGNAISENEPGEAVAVLRDLWGVGRVNNNAGLPPMVQPFHWSANRRGDRVRLYGHYPDRAVRQTIIGMTRAAVPGLEVVDRMRPGRGVPQTDAWLAGLSFALKQLASLKRGEVRLEDLALTISGETEDAEAYRSVTAALKRGLPKGITLAGVQIAAPVVSPFTWSAQFAGGQLVLSGHVAGEGARADLLAAARPAVGTDVVDRMEPAGGAPAGWTEAAAVLIKEIMRLQSGSAEMKDATIVVGGIAADEAQAQAVRDGLRASLPPAFKLADQIRVRETKVETKPAEAVPSVPAHPSAAAPAEKPAPAPAEQPGKDAALLTPPAAAPQAPREAQPASPPPPEARPPEAAPSAAAPEAPPPAAAAPAPEAPAPVAEAQPKAAPAPAPAVDLAVCRSDLSSLAAANPVTFERGSSKLEGAGLEALGRIAEAVKACPGVRIAAEGHTDIEGSPEHNQRLSLKRAQAVAEYLVEAGVAAEQVQTAGFGTSRPAAPNNTPQSRAKNRRTEIVVRP